MREIDGRYGCKRVSKDSSRTDDRQNGKHYSTEAENIPRVEGAGSVEKKALTKGAVSEFCMVLAKTELQLTHRKTRKEVGNIAGLVSGASFYAGELCRRMKKFDDWKRILDCSRNEEVAGDSFKKN